MTAKVTVADVERVAELANLELKPEETRNMLHDLNAILDHVAQLNELDTSGVAPLAQVSELEGTTRASTLRAGQDSAIAGASEGHAAGAGNRRKFLQSSQGD
jgi:aspartyl/glutamyl-tRNA(Asn/Gln) amidotransferase C subunit